MKYPPLVLQGASGFQRIQEHPAEVAFHAVQGGQLAHWTESLRTFGGIDGLVLTVSHSVVHPAAWVGYILRRKMMSCLWERCLFWRPQHSIFSSLFIYKYCPGSSERCWALKACVLLGNTSEKFLGTSILSLCPSSRLSVTLVHYYYFFDAAERKMYPMAEGRDMSNLRPLQKLCYNDI